MSARLVEPMDDATQWMALRADGVTPSAALSIVDEQTTVGYGADGHSVFVTASADANGHLLRRALPLAVDISAFAELRLSIRADLRAGAIGAPFFLELRLGSQAMPLEDPANGWHRLLPVHKPDVWETVRLSLADLPIAVAGGVTQLQLRCLGAPFTVYLDDVVAVLPQMLADADRALESRLAGITVADGPATAVVRAADEAAPAAPALDIVHFGLRYAPGRAREQRLLRDFTATGAREVSLGEPYDLDYMLTPVAASRTAQAGLIEAVLDRLSSYDELSVDGELLPGELTWSTGPGREVPVLFYRIGVRRPAVLGSPVREVRELRLESGYLEAV